MNPIWNIASKATAYPPLREPREADTVIIGAGVTGLATALKLIEAGQRVVVLEALSVGAGGTGRSTGNLYGTLSTGLAEIRKKHSISTLRTIVKRRMQAISFIEQTVAKYHIECEFSRCSMYLCVRAPIQDAVRRLEAEFEASIDAGLVCAWVKNAPTLPFSVHRAIEIENQAQFNPRSYLEGLAQAVVERGGQIFENTRVTQVDGRRGIVTTDSSRVRAHDIVYATHTPKGINVLQAEMQPYQEYGVAAELKGEEYPDGAFWILDDSKSLRSYRYQGKHYLIVIGGKHKTGHGTLGVGYYDMLKDYAKTHFDVAAFEHQWSAQQYIPADQLPYIGRSAHQNVHVGTGYSADGLTWGVVAADILGRQVLGHKEDEDELFNSRRFTPFKSGKNWFTENKTVAMHWLKARFGAEKNSHIKHISAGDGDVVNINGANLAVHRTPGGELKVLSAECPHMKCLVRWNGAERTWDCPCHGSRFSVDGKLIEGPAFEGLQSQRLNTD